MPEHQERIYFDLDPGEWHGQPREGLWGEKIENSPSGTVYRLMNSPFFARGVSFRDVVRATRGHDGEELQFAGVLDRSGHSTYMILVPPDARSFEDYWSRLEALGCTYESATWNISLGKRTLYSVDVPDTTDIYRVYAILEEGEKVGLWRFQEGHVGHKLKS